MLTKKMRHFTTPLGAKSKLTVIELAEMLDWIKRQGRVIIDR